ncbi:MAG: NADH-quinone oxidoreductase subunit NuoE [Anaerovoracaceae bacterium]
MEVTRNAIDSILKRYERDRRHALAMMQDMQRQFQYIPREGMEMLADYLDCPEAQLYAMATFYKALSLKPKGKHIIKCCDGTACHIRGSLSLIGEIKRQIGIEPGETTADGIFSFETVNCVGSCALAPVLIVDDTYYGKVTMDSIGEILAKYN